ncbi:uracil permease-1 [Coleophoma cylindrospora]|uniref:Uracil permease-1 n=1 Tax=Coleophoma cylindrospora TaxID=1849047 RepID=A0A3D8S8H4_9HELO|nr:uracil permease-1 [Coleophoma cylindrospora]
MFSKLKRAFSSKRAFIHFLEAPQNEHAEISRDGRREHSWSNDDLDPSKPSYRTWTWLHFGSYWLASSFASGTWTTASAMVSLGMPWYASWLAIVVSHFIGILIVVANGRAAAVYHIGFPVYARASFGMWGSYFAIASRSMLAAIWYAVNSYYGANFASICIRCIWPSWTSLQNTIPASQGVTTQQMVALLVFWLLSMPFIFIHPRNLNWYFVAKASIVAPACFGVLAWAVIENGGSIGPTFASAPKLESSWYYGWLWMSALNTGFGGTSPLIVGQADIARYAKKPSDQTWAQVIMFPICSALPALFGILVASATANMWGKQYWNLWDVLSAALDHYDMSPASRALVFLSSFAFCVALLGTNVSANSLPFGSDISGLFPRWINIRRGQVLCASLTFALVPWKIITSAKALLTFLAGYSIFMGPFAAICITDYFFIRRGNFHMADLYVGNSSSRYWYWHGINLRAIGSWLIGIALPFPGFVATMGNIKISDTGNHLWYLGFLLGFVLTCFVYWLSYVVFPMKMEEEKSLEFEELAVKYDALLEEQEANEMMGHAAHSDSSSAVAEDTDIEKGNTSPKIVQM